MILFVCVCVFNVAVVNIRKKKKRRYFLEDNTVVLDQHRNSALQHGVWFRDFVDYYRDCGGVTISLGAI